MKVRKLLPGIWTDPEFNRLSDKAKLLTLALANYADDEGYFIAQPRPIRDACAPWAADAGEINRLLVEIAQAGMIEIGTGPGLPPIVAEQVYGRFPRFSRFMGASLGRFTPSRLKDLPIDWMKHDTPQETA